MKTFKEWVEENKLNEGRPVDWSPSPRLDFNIVTSIMRKINLADKQGQMPFDGNFAGLDPMQVRFGLDDAEMEVLRKSGLISKTEYGYNVDQQKFNDLFGKIGKVTNTFVPGTRVPDWIKDHQTQNYRPESRTFPRVGSQPASRTN
jgi:hypothetical protein